MNIVVPPATGAIRTLGRRDNPGRLSAVAAMIAAIVYVCAHTADDATRFGENQASDTIAGERAALADKVRYRGGETFVGAYGGAPYTYASDVRLTRPGTDMTVHGIDWEGRPFDNPIYYGVRVARWLPMRAIGGMIDFTHSKAYAPLDQTVRASGTKDGQAVAPEAKLGDRFHKLEFTHGHNMLTLNGLVRLPSGSAFLSPYVGVGAGVSLPHTEVQLKGEGLRTYEYQYTGPAVQFVLGLEIRVPRLSYFVEYKFTFADYLAPLHRRDGGWIGFDLWHQVQRWWRGGTPEGGWAATVLASHQIIAGMGYRSAPAALAAP